MFGERSAPLTTVRAAADLLEITPGMPGEAYHPFTPLEPDRMLSIAGRAWPIQPNMRQATVIEPFIDV